MTQTREQLFSELLNENKDRIYRICCGYLNDREDVNDLYQEILINIWNNLSQFRGDAKVSTWVFRIATNTALLHRKKQSKRNLLFTSAETSERKVTAITDEQATEQKISFEKKLHLLYDCIAQLESENRLIISLSLEGLSYQEIADVVGITINHVGVKINRIKSQLTKLMQEKKDE